MALEKSLPDGRTVHVKFDVAQVVQRASEEYAEEEEMEMDEESSPSQAMDNIELEVDVIKGGKKLTLACELDFSYEEAADEAAAEEDSPTEQAMLFVTDARITPVDATTPEASRYDGPEYDTLAEELQEQITSYAEDLLGSDLKGLGAFIDAYSGSKEGQQYGQWLEEVKAVV